MSLTDGELLRRYVQTGSDASFAELVERHFRLVYSAALRQVAGDTELARDIAQSVFTDLARKSRALATRTSLAGWLFTSARFAAIKAIRGERRRRLREHEACAMQQLTTPEPDWSRLQPCIDEAMHELNDDDREVVVLRFFQQRNLRSVGAVFGISEDAARKRVERAIDRLRLILERRDVRVGTGSLAAAIMTYGIVPVPSSVAAAVAASAAACAAGAGGTASFLNFMAITKSKAVGAVVLAGAVGTILVQQRSVNRLQSEKAALRETAALVEQLRAENARRAQVAVDSAELQRLRGQQLELMRLRGEVTQLRQAMALNPHTKPELAVENPQSEQRPPVTVFAAEANVSVESRGAVITGGWATASGKRTYVILVPEIGDDQPEQVTVTASFVELPESVVSELGWEHLTGDGTRNVQSTVDAKEISGLMERIGQASGATVLSAPRVTTLTGRQALVQVTEAKTIHGQQVWLGPVLDLVPHINADGSSVSLEVSARLTLPTEPEP